MCIVLGHVHGRVDAISGRTNVHASQRPFSDSKMPVDPLTLSSVQGYADVVSSRAYDVS